jgi:hypothetical protein
MVPADAARYGIKTGSAGEWANFMSQLAGKESSYNPAAHGDVGRFGGAGSHGLFQLSPQDALIYGLQDRPFSLDQLRDPDFNARTAVAIAAKRVAAGGIGGPEGMAKYWGPLQRGWRPRSESGSFSSGGSGGLPSAIASQAQRMALMGPAALKQYMASIGHPQNDQWCGDFAAAAVKAAGGIPPNNPQIASNWLNWGTGVSDPVAGDIAAKIKSRFGGPVIPGLTGGHVTTYAGEDPNDPDRFLGTGGNQSRRTESFPKSQFVFRRAAGGDWTRPNEGGSDWIRQSARPWPGIGDDRDVRSSKFLDRRELDRAMGREITSKVEGSGHISVDVKAPRGTHVTARGGGIFKRSSINRQTQMEKSHSGPPEKISGVGSRDIPSGEDIAGI